MYALRNIKIGARLGFMAGALLLLLLLLAGASIYGIRSVNAQVVDMGENWLPSVEALGQIDHLGNSTRRLAFKYVLSLNAASKREMLDRHDSIVKDAMPATLARYEKMVSSPQEKALYDQIIENWRTYLEAEKELFAAADAGEGRFNEARTAADGASNKAYLDFEDAVKKDIELNVRGGEEAKKQAVQTYTYALEVVATLVVISLAMGATLTVLMTKSITAPMSEAVRVADAVAAGDLTVHVSDAGKDEATALMSALRTMRDGLRKIVMDVRMSSDSIETGATEIASGNADLSQRTESQASNLQQTASSLEQLSGGVQQSASGAVTATDLANTATRVAERGGEVVTQVITTMDDINSASRRIADIISTIDGIAFQTNILALNAAVEAARAGEQGRGFAVVAGEVRSLAQRSATAAREIKDLIGNSVERVAAGANLVQEAGTTMNEIVASVKQVLDRIGEISLAATEQSQGIGQINVAVSQLDQMTQQNAALVEESAAAAESLKQQARHLTELVHLFRT